MKKKPLWSSPSLRSQWRENNGSLLVGLAVGVLALGFCLIAYQQFRFVPVRFPGSDAIDPPIPTKADPVRTPNPGPANPGPANPGPANPGPANPGPANPGTVTPPEARAPAAEPPPPRDASPAT